MKDSGSGCFKASMIVDIFHEIGGRFYTSLLLVLCVVIFCFISVSSYTRFAQHLDLDHRIALISMMLQLG